MGPFIKFLDKWDIPMLEYANKYKNPFLRKVFLSFGEEITYMSFFAIIFMMGSYAGKSGYPIGGSLAFAKKMEEKYLSLGGKVNYNSRVEKIIVENNSASGILLEDGNSHKSDMVISAADGYSTIFNMLEGKYINNKIKSYYEGALKPFPAIIQLSLGVKREFKDQEHALSIPLQERIKVDPANSLERLTIKFYNFDPTLAPKGCTSVVTFFTADHSYWADLRKNDRQKYNAEKKRITDEIIKELDQRFPGLAEDVEVTDLATPATYIRYTNNWKGSFEGWLIDRKSMMLQINKQLPGLKNFYMIGQWVSPGGGLPSGVTTGRDVTQIICRKDKKEFKVD
jgi:phytoene dehydrogenase-like protein